MPPLTCTISGSFRRFLSEISVKVKECNEQGVTVLSPVSCQATGEAEGFIFLKSDRGEPKEIESHHLKAIRRSDFLYVVNPAGYVGPSTTMEIGYALALGIPVFSLEPPVDPILSLFIHSEPTIEKVKRELGKQSSVEIPERADLATLQAYIRRVVRLRGFEEESLRDVVLLLIEEVGELAKAVRRQIGLKVAGTHPEDRKIIAYELADCLIYLLDIANLAHVDLDDAFRAKEEINAKKKWRSEEHPQ